MNLKLLSRLKTRDSAVLYEYLFESLNRSSGQTEETTLERIAANMTSDGIMTARGAAFSASVLRSKFAELEALDLVERVTTSSGAFRVAVFMPFTNSEPIEERVQVVEDLRAANMLHKNENENENENGNGNGKRVQKLEPDKEYILLINKQINKTRENEKQRMETQDSHAVEAKVPERVDDCPNASNIQKLVNFTAPKVAKFRDAIVRRIWEREINPELIDRLTALAVLKIGGMTAAQVFGICSEAKDSAQRYERTDGRAGCRHMWQTIGYSCKRIYEAAGWRWTPTKIGVEPKPEPNRAPIVAPE